MGFLKYKRQLALMQVFGLFMGVIFPIYARFFVTFNSRPAFYIFWAGCLLAGSIVGWVCYFIFYTPQSELEKRNEELFNKVMEFEAMKIERDVLVEELGEKEGTE
jgi:hypothetical protein